MPKDIYDALAYALDHALDRAEHPASLSTYRVRPTGEPGVWSVREPEALRDCAVYLYQSGLWRCSAHLGRRDCRDILAVQASPCPNCGEPLGNAPTLTPGWCRTCWEGYEEGRVDSFAQRSAKGRERP